MALIPLLTIAFQSVDAFGTFFLIKPASDKQIPVFQNLKLDGNKNLLLEVKEPFLTMMGIKNGQLRPIDCPAPERSRTNFSLYTTKNDLKKETR